MLAKVNKTSNSGAREVRVKEGTVWNNALQDEQVHSSFALWENNTASGLGLLDLLSGLVLLPRSVRELL